MTDLPARIMLIVRAVTEALRQSSAQIEEATDLRSVSLVISFGRDGKPLSAIVRTESRRRLK